MLNDTGVSNPPDSNRIDTVQKNLYSQSDSGPFFVFVEKKANTRYYLDSDGKEVQFNDESPLVQMINAGEILTKSTNQPMHPMLFGKILFEKLHHFKHTILGITRLNKFKNRVEFQSGPEANRFVNDKHLHDLGYEAYIPLFINTKFGIIRDFPTEIDENEILNNEVCISQFKIIKAERLKRVIKSNEGTASLQPTNSIKITFASQTLPNYIIIHSVKTEVIPYIPRPIICLSCLRYGHKASGCRSKRRCSSCMLEHDITVCTSSDPPKCAHCGGEHIATNTRICPEYQKQMKIKELMTLKSYSFKEALSIVNYKPYLDAVSIIPPPPIVFDSKNFPSLNNSSSNNKTIPQKRIRFDNESDQNNKKHFKIKTQNERKPHPPRPKSNFKLPNNNINIATSPMPRNPYRPGGINQEEDNSKMDSSESINIMNSTSFTINTPGNPLNINNSNLNVNLIDDTLSHMSNNNR